jgi:hypothetical protein
MRLWILDRVEDDLVAGYRFFEDREPGLGQYFLQSLYSDIESVRLHGVSTGECNGTFIECRRRASQCRVIVSGFVVCERPGLAALTVRSACLTSPHISGILTESGAARMQV